MKGPYLFEVFPPSHCCSPCPTALLFFAMSSLSVKGIWLQPCVDALRFFPPVSCPFSRSAVLPFLPPFSPLTLPLHYRFVSSHLCVSSAVLSSSPRFAMPHLCFHYCPFRSLPRACCVPARAFFPSPNSLLLLFRFLQGLRWGNLAVSVFLVFLF